MTARYDKLVADWPADVPFERVVRQRLSLFDDLIKQGLTWSSIAAALARAGVTQRSGRPLSRRQLNAVYLRCKKKSAATNMSVLPPIVENVRLPMGPTPRQSAPPKTGLVGRLAEARSLIKSRMSEYDE
ncbi:hypothetical protein PRN20_06050 [Devosia sp. ZB163]|uniref:hypothetical protein n=1 Tax=Devosia sp. ZB163 TaxID=3025938 RepID=UPI0023629CD3|nr:hypothetical protein [Devosia sp. ZB163]MDC9823287.1 hypothetical protein [Devosia sp. ZB163]